MSALLPPHIVRIASAEIGVTEVNGSNCGPRVDEYKAATWLDPKKGWPWCAAFVCWVVKQALDHAEVKETATFKRPRTAGAWDMENWSRKQDESTWTRKPHRGDIAPGDIVVFTFSHVGFAVSAPDKSGFVMTVEGNTDSSGSREGGGVFRKRRHVSTIRSRIRFRV
jgi:CHAP domain